VELSVNGTQVATMSASQCPQRACVFKDVKLAFGDNFIVATGNHAGVSVTDRVRWSLNTKDINIAAGRLATGLVTSDGARFGSDHFFSGGQYGPPAREASALDVFQGGQGQNLEPIGDALLLQHYRRGDFSYDIPLDDGSYDVTLGFVEPAGDAMVGGRVFNVAANGILVLDDLDIFRESSGPQTLVSKAFPMNVTGGRLRLEFKPSKGEAVVSYIRVRKRSP
jgi:beta-galactosidase